MAIFLGVLVAMSFGTGDFLGGNATRRFPIVPVLVVVQGIAILGAVAYALVFSGTATGRDLWFGLAAGSLNVIALGSLFSGLATGRMGIVAPITAVIAACIPVTWGLAHGDDLSTVTFIGVVVAIGAGGLIAREQDDTRNGGIGAAMLYALVAGVLFGWSLVLYAESSDGSGAWPVLTGRVGSVALVLLAFLFVRARWQQRVLPRATPEFRMAVGAGLLDVTATALLLVAVREGLISTVAPVSALGPAFTVIWAWLVLHEPIGRIQVGGLVAALAGLVMISAG